MSEAADSRARERILAAAVERIASDGIDDMRIARVAMDARVSTSLVHYHFETREALLAEALEYSYELAGDIRIGEAEGEVAGHVERLAGLLDQFLPYPGILERDWILWVELWLRTVRHPELRPTAARLYERMRNWLAEAIAAGIEDGAFNGEADPQRAADRLMALGDGYGVRVLSGGLDIEHARQEIWAGLASELGLPDKPPPRQAGRVASHTRSCPRRPSGVGFLNRYSSYSEGSDAMSPRPRLDHVRRPELLEAAAAVIRRRGLENARVADIAEEAGTSAPSVLYYFATKAELLNEALTSAEERYYEELAAGLAGIESARERLAVIIDSGAGEGDYDSALWMELWAKALRDPELATTRAELDGRWRRTIAEVVDYGQQRDEFGPADPEEFAVLLGSLLDGLSVQVALRDVEVTAERVRELAVALAERELGCELPAAREPAA